MESSKTSETAETLYISQLPPLKEVTETGSPSKDSFLAKVMGKWERWLSGGHVKGRWEAKEGRIKGRWGADDGQIKSRWGADEGQWKGRSGAYEG